MKVNIAQEIPTFLVTALIELDMQVICGMLEHIEFLEI